MRRMRSDRHGLSTSHMVVARALVHARPASGTGLLDGIAVLGIELNRPVPASDGMRRFWPAGPVGPGTSPTCLADKITVI